MDLHLASLFGFTPRACIQSRELLLPKISLFEKFDLPWLWILLALFDTGKIHSSIFGDIFLPLSVSFNSSSSSLVTFHIFKISSFCQSVVKVNDLSSTVFFVRNLQVKISIFSFSEAAAALLKMSSSWTSQHLQMWQRFICLLFILFCYSIAHEEQGGNETQTRFQVGYSDENTPTNTPAYIEKRRRKARNLWCRTLHIKSTCAKFRQSSRT